MKEKQRHCDEYNRNESQAEKGQGIAKNQSSLHAPLILCFQGHRPVRRVPYFSKGTYLVYGFEADRNSSADCRPIKPPAVRDTGGFRGINSVQRARFRLDRVLFPAGWLLRLIEGLCGFLIVGEVWCWGCRKDCCG